MRSKVHSFMKRVGFKNIDFSNASKSFDDQLKRESKKQSGNCIVSQGTTFIKANDISNASFNPVISKIENFMAKKERKNSTSSNLNG